MTKKLLSLLLSVLMVLSMATPALAAPLDSFEPIGGQADAESEVVEEPQAAVDETAELAPIGESDAEIQASKPSKLRKATVDKMAIRAYGFAKDASGKEVTGDGTPQIKAKGVSYTIGNVEGDETNGYTTTVTFHFKSGDKFEAAASNSLNDHIAFKNAGISGNWVYSFSADRPADQVLTLYWIVAANGRGAWNIKTAPSKLNPSGYTTNLISAVANIIKVNLRLDTDTTVNHSVIYDDGMNGIIFSRRTFSVEEGQPTPAFDGNLAANDNYEFVKWTPDVAATVTEDVTYVASWREVERHTVTFNGNGAKLSDVIAGSYTSKTKFVVGSEVKLSSAMDGKKFTKDLSADCTTNYRQVGWNTEKDGSGTHYAMNGKMTMPAHDVILYAEWEPYEWIHWNIQLAGEGGDYISYTEGVTGGTTHNVQSFKAYTNQYGKVPAAYYTPVVAVPKLGFAFAGWYDVAKDELISDKATLTMQDFRNLRALKSAESGSVIEARFVPRVPGNVHLVIYKSTDLTKRIVDTKIPDLYVDDVFTPNIADYYSSANGFEYVGWFNDGNFNNYKNGSNYTEAESITVSGQWQNVIAVVTDYEKVIVKAVYDGDKANAQTIYSGRALRGSNLVEFLEANAGVGEVKGYALDKWYNWDWYGHKVGDNATVNGWTNVYVTYTKNVFKVTYTDGVDGEEIFADQSYDVKYDEATPEFNGTPARTGYTFLGWEPVVAEKVTANVTYVAQWEKLFTVTYKDPYNSFEQQVYYVEKGGKVPAFVGTPERAGYVFSTWNDVYKEVTGPVGETVDRDRVFSARWVALPKDLDEATALAKGDVRVTDILRQNGNYDLRHVDLIAGTFTVNESRWDAEKKAVLATITINKADFEKYGAGLEKIEGFTYHFNSLGSYTDTDSEGNLVLHFKNRFSHNGTTRVVGSFGGWLIDGDYYPSRARAQLLFDRYYQVTYTDGINGESFADVSMEAKENEATPAFNGTPTRTGYTFTGWSPVVAEKVTANATYVAQWEANTYTVTFNSNGGSKLASITVTYGQKYGNLPSAGYVDGLQNLGWYLVDENGNVTDTSIGDRTIVTLTRNHELFQKREIKTPKVKLSLSRPIYNYLEEPVTIQSSGITEYAALKYSYQWYKDDVALTDGDIYDGATTANLTLKHDYVSCSGKYKLVVTITLADGSEIVVTNAPVTAEATYDVLIRRSSNMLYYDANGGVGGPSNNSDYYDKENDRYIAKVSDINYGYDGPLTRKGYHFTGWNTEKDGSGETYQPGDFYVFDRQLSENGGLKVYLYAQWEACENHFEDVKVITEPTCTEKGLKLCRCTVCGTEYETEIPALGHDLTGWIWNRTEHWKRCKRCGELFEVEKHNLTEWKNVVRNGEVVEEHHCTVCGFSECAQTIHIDGTKPQPGVEINPATGAEAPSVLPALAVLAGVAVILGKRK